MTVAILKRWRDANGGQLPEVLLYYRDGISYGQFEQVGRFERNLLAHAFREAGKEAEVDAYDPELAIIVGQKRHHTRLFLAEESADADQSKGDVIGKGGVTVGGKKGKGDIGKASKGGVTVGGKKGKGDIGK